MKYALTVRLMCSIMLVAGCSVAYAAESCISKQEADDAIKDTIDGIEGKGEFANIITQDFNLAAPTLAASQNYLHARYDIQRKWLSKYLSVDAKDYFDAPSKHNWNVEYEWRKDNYSSPDYDRSTKSFPNKGCVYYIHMDSPSLTCNNGQQLRIYFLIAQSEKTGRPIVNEVGLTPVECKWNGVKSDKHKPG